MNKSKIDSLEKCIELIKAGASYEDCMADLAPELREILKTTSDLLKLRQEEVPADGMARSRIQLLEQAKWLTSNETHPVTLSGFNRSMMRIGNTFIGILSPRLFIGRLILALMVTALLIGFSRGLVITSAKSLPGDSLYPLKLAVEDISVLLVPNPEVRQTYEENYSLQRVDEVKRLIELKRVSKISFEGMLGSTNDTSWVVSGIPVELQPSTMLLGGIANNNLFVAGAVVEVEGITTVQGTVTANEIHLREYQFYGVVQDISKNSWQISDTQILITTKSQVDAGIQTGDAVAVLIRSEDNGLYALSIHLTAKPSSSASIDQHYSGDALANRQPEVSHEMESQDSSELIGGERPADAIQAPENEVQDVSEAGSEDVLQELSSEEQIGEHDEEQDALPEDHTDSEHSADSPETP